jgi:hypothetical protein
MKFLTDSEVPLRKKLSLAVILIFAALVAVLNHGCSAGDDEESDEALTFDLFNPVIQERLGTDDGYAFAIFYGGDIHGSLETCG